MNSREQFEKWMGIKMSGQAHTFGLEAWKAGYAQALEEAENVCLEASFKAQSLEASKAAHSCVERIRQMKWE